MNNDSSGGHWRDKPAMGGGFIPADGTIIALRRLSLPVDPGVCARCDMPMLVMNGIASMASGARHAPAARIDIDSGSLHQSRALRRRFMENGVFRRATGCQET